MTEVAKKRMIAIGLILLVILSLALWITWSDKALELNNYKISDNLIPESFDGFRIAQISDFHNTEIGANNKKLISVLKESNPDIIAITGDFIDSRNTDIQLALQFAKEAVKIAPCYYVSGNHEARIAEYSTLKEELIKLGVVILEDEGVLIEKSSEKITILGVDDPNIKRDYLPNESRFDLDDKLSELLNENDYYTVLLSHRPELFDIYVKNNVDLVLSGHAHGGQFRLPFLGGIVAPDQGFFPEYDSGIYSENNTSMIVSRGIGNSIIPIRFNNRPEIILIELSHLQ